MKKFDFTEQNSVGVAGEKYFALCYGGLCNPVKSPDFAYDFDSTCGKIELKTDTYPMEATGNFFFELYSDTKSMKLGGPWRSRADSIPHFVYMYLTNRTYFWFNSTELANFLDDYVMGKKPKTIKNKGWETIGYTVPRVAVEHLYKSDTFDANGIKQETI